jgi:hypothetical protein
MGSDDTQRLYDMMLALSNRMATVEALLTEAIDGPIDVSRLRWDGRAINFVVMKIVVPVLLTICLGGAAFYYGLSAKFDVFAYKFDQHISIAHGRK